MTKDELITSAEPARVDMLNLIGHLNNIQPENYDLSELKYVDMLISYAADKYEMYGGEWPGWSGFYNMFRTNLLTYKDVAITYQGCLDQINETVKNLKS